MKFLNKIDGADKVVTDSSNRFVTDTEKDTWNGKVDASQVLTDVPANAVFTDTNTVTSINGKTGAITKADIVALGIPAQDTVIDISGKVDKVSGKELSTNDYTTIEKNKLNNIEAGANNYVLETHSASKHSDIDQSLLKSDTVQFNKIGIGTATPNESLDVVGSVRVRGENSMKFGGVGASDSNCEIRYNSTTKSMDFNFF